MPIFFSLAMLVIFLFAVVSIARQWIQNNNSPRLTVEAVVVSRRTYTTQQPVAGDPTGASGFHTTTDCVVIFEVESGDQLKFSVSGGEYRALEEGDRGRLTFQGTRYLGFERER